MAGGELRRLWGDGLGRAERLKAAEESAGEALGVKDEDGGSISKAEDAAAETSSIKARDPL
jgi:hypothetical protein